MLNILRKYGLDKLPRIPQRLESFSGNDWSCLYDDLNSRYRQVNPIQEKQPHPSIFTFCFPVLPASALNATATYLALGDKIYLDDALAPIAYKLSFLDIGKHSAQRVVSSLAKKRLVSEATQLVYFYLRSKELLQERRLILYSSQCNPIDRPPILKGYAYPNNHAVKEDKILKRILCENTSDLTL